MGSGSVYLIQSNNMQSSSGLEQLSAGMFTLQFSLLRVIGPKNKA